MAITRTATISGTWTCIDNKGTDFGLHAIDDIELEETVENDFGEALNIWVDRRAYDAVKEACENTCESICTSCFCDHDSISWTVTDTSEEGEPEEGEPEEEVKRKRTCIERRQQKINYWKAKMKANRYNPIKVVDLSDNVLASYFACRFEFPDEKIIIPTKRELQEEVLGGYYFYERAGEGVGTAKLNEKDIQRIVNEYVPYACKQGWQCHNYGSERICDVCISSNEMAARLGNKVTGSEITRVSRGEVWKKYSSTWTFISTEGKALFSVEVDKYGKPAEPGKIIEPPAPRVPPKVPPRVPPTPRVPPKVPEVSTPPVITTTPPPISTPPVITTTPPPTTPSTPPALPPAGTGAGMGTGTEALPPARLGRRRRNEKDHQMRWQ